MPPKKPGPIGSLSETLRWFLALTAWNSLLSYAPLPSGWREALSYLTLALLSIVLFRSRDARPLAPPRPLPDPGPWAVPLSLLLLAVLLFYKLTSFAAWPLYDEAVNGLYALDNMHGWDGRLHYYYSAIPPMQVWMTAALFRLFVPGKAALWLLPALLVLGSVFLLHASARRFLPRAEALLVAGLAGFSFWAMEAARISHPYVLVLFWGSLCLYVAVLVPPIRGTVWALAGSLGLGLLTGAGFYTFYSWPAVALALALVFSFLLACGRERSRRRGGVLTSLLAAFAVPAILLALPVLNNIHRGVYDGHVARLLDLSLSPASFGTRLRYIASLFWVHEDAFRCGPFSGGLLNPLEAAWFFLGCRELVRGGRRGQGPMTVLLFLALLLPALLSKTVHDTRVIQLLPLCAFVAFLGLRRLTGEGSRPWRRILLLVAASLLLNVHHLWGPARSWFTDPAKWGFDRNVEQYRADRVLEAVARRRGPGLLFMRLEARPFDFSTLNPSLYVLSYPWNILSGWKAPPPEADWVAIVTQRYHQAYLSRRFPGSRWFGLTADPSTFREDCVLGVIPRVSFPSRDLLAWVEAERFLARLWRGVLDDPRLAADPIPVRKDYQDRLEAKKDLFEADPFLKAVFLEQELRLYGMKPVRFDMEGFFKECRRSSYRSPYLLVMESRYDESRGERAKAEVLKREANRVYSEGTGR